MPRTGPMTVRVGKASLLKAEKVRTDQKKVGTSTWEESYQVRVWNLGTSDTEVTDVEEFPGEWTIIQSTPSAWVKSSSSTAQFTVAVPSGGRGEILFKVRFTL